MSPKDLSVDTVAARLRLMRELLDVLGSVGAPTSTELREDALMPAGRNHEGRGVVR